MLDTPRLNRLYKYSRYSNNLRQLETLDGVKGREKLTSGGKKSRNTVTLFSAGRGGGRVVEKKNGCGGEELNPCKYKFVLQIGPYCV